MPRVTGVQTLDENTGVDIATTVVLLYKDGRQCVATSHMGVPQLPGPQDFCRIDGSEVITAIAPADTIDDPVGDAGFRLRDCARRE